jgi:hypothetical protein
MTDQELAAQMKLAHGIAIDPASALAAAGLVAGLNTAVRDAATAKLAFEDEPSHYLTLLAAGGKR